MNSCLEERLDENTTCISAPKATKLIARMLGNDKNFPTQPDSILFGGYVRAVVSMGTETYCIEGDYLTVCPGDEGELILSSGIDNICIPCKDATQMYLPALCKGSFFWNDRLKLDILRLAKGTRQENLIAHIDIHWDSAEKVYSLPANEPNKTNHSN